MTDSITIQVYRWAGAWGPFKVNIPCGECSLTKDIIQDTIDTDLVGIDVVIEMRDWLSEWWKPLLKGGWHAPIVLVDGKIISQGRALNRGLLTEAVIEAYANKTAEYTYRDVIKEPRALYEMLARVKPIIGPKTPVTVPQIWLDGSYVGGASELSELLKSEVQANPERGQCSLSPDRK